VTVAEGVRPLSSVRILDMTVAWAGPYATMLLADLGAEVIRVENVNVFPSMSRGMQARPSREFIRAQIAEVGGYPDREPGKRPWNRCPFFNVHARNKKSVTIDVRSPRGLELFFALAAMSDVVIENNPMETLEKLGITWERLSEINERLIFARMPAFGNSGPYRGYRALGTHLEAFLGQTALRRYPELDPSMNNTTFASDFLGGTSAAQAVLLALFQRKTTGRGCLIEVSQAENALALMAEAIMDWTGNHREREPLGNRDEFAIQGCYPCRSIGTDRWINIQISTDTEWANLKRAMGSPEWAEDPAFHEVISRRSRQDEIDTRIAAWTREADAWELSRRLQALGVTAGPVIDHSLAFEDEHLKARRFFVRLSNEDCGEHLYPGAAWKSEKSPVQFDRGPVRLGEDNEYVYLDLLGISREEYERLKDEGALGEEYRL
jgi:crotonobetainyl-CoA:carnitine CoA-transferase CaiB-like acyl-CoA transferase